MKIVRLTQEHAFKPFDCGEGDLNDFLLQDGFKPLRKENEGETVPMYYDLTQLV